MRPFLGDKQVVEMVQRAVHSGTPSMIETRFPNRSGPSMLFVRSSPTVKNFIDGLQVTAHRTLRRSFCCWLHIVSVFAQFCPFLFVLQSDALISENSVAAPLPKEQRDMKVVQVD